MQFVLYSEKTVAQRLTANARMQVEETALRPGVDGRVEKGSFSLSLSTPVIGRLAIR